MKKFILMLFFLSCKSNSDNSNDYSIYGILYPNYIYVAFYDVKNQQVITDANVFVGNEQMSSDIKLSYYHPFYNASINYVPKIQYHLNLYYNGFSSSILFNTIDLPDTFFIIPNLDTIALNQNLLISIKVDSSYKANHNYYFVVFFENKSKNPTLVYQTDFLDKNTQTITIDGKYIDTPSSRYEVRVFLVQYDVLDQFKPYPNYRFSFIAYGQVAIGVYWTR
jgi:hypothetical protein